MKVLIVVSDFPKVTETFVLRNALHFLKTGHDVDMVHLKAFRQAELVHRDFSDVMDRAVSLPWVSLSAAGVFLRHAGKTLGYGARIVRAFWRKPKHGLISLALLPKALALAAHCRATGVEHIHAEFAGYPATVAWIAAGLAGIPFSFSAHAHDIFIVQGLLANKARDAAFVRAISTFNQRFLNALPGMPQDRVEVIRCGVVVPDTPPLPERGDGVFRILFVGALLPRKGVDVLIRAVQDLPEGTPWHLDILGGGSQDVALRGMAQSSGARITFHGPQPSDKVRAAMAAAHVVVVPSREGAEGRSEGIPVVLMEALALARPVIASRLSGIPELVVDGETGLLVEPDDVAGLRDAIADLMQDAERAALLAQAGRAKVAQDFNIDLTAAQLLSRVEETTP